MSTIILHVTNEWGMPNIFLEVFKVNHIQINTCVYSAKNRYNICPTDL